MSFRMGIGLVSSTTDKTLLLALVVVVFFLPSPVAAQSSGSAPSADWDRLVEAAKKEGKVTISIPASAEMRKQLEENFKKRFGIEVEVFTARGSAGVRRLDVDTKWLRETGVIPAKDHLSVKEFLQVENQSEEKLDKAREPAQKFAATILK